VSHLSVRTLIKDAAQSLADNIQFGYGRRSDFNLIKDPSSPYVWLLPLTSNPRFAVNNVEIYQKTWNCIVLFLYEDRTDSIETEFDHILDDMDTLVDKFIIRLNDFYLKSTDTVGTITLQNFSQNPFIKSDADIFTGWFLTFQMVVSSDFEYCTPDNIALYANL
jgi:hypothetical protein